MDRKSEERRVYLLSLKITVMTFALLAILFSMGKLKQGAIRQKIGLLFGVDSSQPTPQRKAKITRKTPSQDQSSSQVD